MTSWIYYLEEDYPDSGLYEKYYSLYIQDKDLTVTKKYIAACPVDVYIYDSADNLVAYVIDNKPYCSGNLTVAVVDDTKELCFYDDEEYRIEYVGNDMGTMDLTITEYGSDGAEQRNVCFYDINLSDGRTYTIGETEQTPNEITYLLDEKDGEMIQADLDTNNTVDEKYTVRINSGSMIINGELFLETDAYVDENIDIYAYLPDGYEFYGWTFDLGTDIFTDASSRITTLRVPASDVTINAVSVNSSGEIYTITFNANGGAVTPATAKTGKDGTIISLPTPTRNGYTFDGWYTEETDGEKVDEHKIYTADTTLYAHWTAISGSNTGGNSGGSSSGGNSSGGGSHSGGSSSGNNSSNSGNNNNSNDNLSDKEDSVTVYGDIPSDAYYYNAVVWAVKNGVTNGTTPTTFSPNSPCTRAQIVTFLWRAAGSPATDEENPFTDVAPDSYYYDAVHWAVAQGITVGTSATTFSPDATCTRGQSVTFLYRHEKSPAVSGGNVFTDVNADAYYADAVQWAVEKGITTGTSAITFSPDQDCTRAQIVTFLYRASSV